MSRQEYFDVAIVGSGVAGLGAAIDAAERGASVVVVEGEALVGGASAISGAACCIVGTPLQEAAGIEDSVDLALSDWITTGGPTADVEWARKYLEASRREVYDWLCSHGIVWTEVARHDGNTVARWHIPRGWGRAVIGALQARAQTLGVTLRTQTCASAVRLTDGRVTGLEVTTAETKADIEASAVIVCTGGYVGDHARLLKEAPQLRSLPRVLSGGSRTARGSGHDLLRQAGARFVYLDQVWVYPNGTPDPDDAAGLRGVGVRALAGAIWLNTRGERFHDESASGGRLGTAALLAQPGQTCWAVFRRDEADAVTLIDNLRWGTPDGPDPVAMAEFWNTSPHAWLATDIDHLADLTALPVDAVRASVRSLDDAIADRLETDPQFGRPLRSVRPLGDGPVAALQLFPMAQKNFGGVRTDLNGQVIGEDGQLIAGLFAAGEVAGMAGGHINGKAALEGTMYGPALYSGRVAGAAAATTGR